MKVVSTFLLLFFGISCMADTLALQQLLAERSRQAMIYKQISDSAGLSNFARIIMLKNQLLKVATIDDGILQHALPVLKDAQAKADSLNQAKSKISSLANERDRLHERTKNDMNMLLILKASVALLLVVILFLLYVVFFKRKSQKSILDQQNTILLNLEREKQELERELSKLKITELNMRQEIDKSRQAIEEKNYVWSEKVRQLEEENLNLANNSAISASSGNNVDISEYEILIEQFKIEHDLLNRQVDQLRVELEEAKTKNASIMKKIVKLINDLSTVSSAE